MTVKLERVTFETKREVEFFREKELQIQLGHGVQAWPLALTKELIDNALDACEIAGIAPVIAVQVDQDRVTVADNGPGLPEKTLERSLDYTVRVSDKTGYVSPSRGQLGNALKCVYAAPFVADGEHGRVQIVTRGKRYTLDVTLDRIAQEPRLELSSEDVASSAGTKVTVFWPDSSGLMAGLRIADFYNEYDIMDLVQDYAIFNPHATFTLDAWSYMHPVRFEATDPKWQKWTPDQPTSAHWYDVGRLRDLIAAYLTNGTEKTVREFVSEFRGASSSVKQKRICKAAGLHGDTLADLKADGDVDIEQVQRLLAALQAETRPVKPKYLGVIGEEHIARGMERLNVDRQSIRYKKAAHMDSEGLPHVLEMAFGVFVEEHCQDSRRIATGLNWASTLHVPVRELQEMLGEMRIDRGDPVCVVMHIARPRFDFVDGGKGVVNV